MSLRSERDDYDENQYKPPVLSDPSNKDKFNLQPDRFGEMSPEAFASLVVEYKKNPPTAGIILRE